MEPLTIEAPAHVLGCDCETCQALDAAARDLRAGLGRMKDAITRAGDICEQSAEFLRETIGNAKKGA